MNTNSTPPIKYTRKVIFNYDENKFAKTISRMTKSLLSQVKVSVWALTPDSNGHCINLLTSDLSEVNYDKLAEHAAYTVYEGTPEALRKLGVA